MKHLRKVVRSSGIEEARRDWEDMRIEVLHEIQDGGQVTEKRLDEAGYTAAWYWRDVLSKPVARTGHHRRN